MIGRTIGTYKITRKIGVGGMGEVFAGEDLMLERQVAIKLLRPELASRPDVVERFRSEAVTLARVNHMNIATVYAFLQEDTDFLLIMEYVQGRTLQHVIQVYGALPPVLAIKLIQQALDGIGFAHQHHIIHRDLKPSNIMLTDDGLIKVMDFGLARVLGSAHVTQIGRLVGTLEYMSPEQVQGSEADVRSDIYALGMVLYELLTGRLPFVHTNEYALMRAQLEDAPPSLREFTEAVSPELDQVIGQALAKAVDDRFQSTEAFAMALAQCVPQTATRSALSVSLSTLNLQTREQVFPKTPAQATQVALHQISEPTGSTVTQRPLQAADRDATASYTPPRPWKISLIAALTGAAAAVVVGVLFFLGRSYIAIEAPGAPEPLPASPPAVASPLSPEPLSFEKPVAEPAFGQASKASSHILDEAVSPLEPPTPLTLPPSSQAPVTELLPPRDEAGEVPASPPVEDAANPTRSEDMSRASAISKASPSPNKVGRPPKSEKRQDHRGSGWIIKR